MLAALAVACPPVGLSIARAIENGSTEQPASAEPPGPSIDIRQDPWFIALDERLGEGTLADRFTSLSPDDPAAYLELAEFIADESSSPAALDTARRLAVLAFSLAGDALVRASAPNAPVIPPPSERTPDPKPDPKPESEPGPIRASACLLLANLSPIESQSAWLRGLARVVEPRFESRDWTRAAARIETVDGAYEAAEALGLVRAGRGNEAARLLERPEVRALIERYDRVLLGEAGGGNVLAMLDRETRVWPCPECQNRRVVVQARGGTGGYGPCGTCNANPGPRLAASELIGHLSLEARLISGVQSSWAAQIAADLAAPLREPDPSELVNSFGWDPGLARWRDGVWVP